MTIYCLLGLKGGTGKSTVAYSLLCYLLSKKMKFFVLNADSSSVTIGVYLRKGHMSKHTVLNLELDKVPSFINQNSSFIAGYDCCLIDTKGEDTDHNVLCDLYACVSKFIITTLASTPSVIPLYSLLDRLVECGGNLQKVYLIYNLLTSSPNSEFFKRLQQEVQVKYKSKGLHICPDYITLVKNMDDRKSRNVNLMSNAHNKRTLTAFFKDVVGQ